MLSGRKKGTPKTGGRKKGTPNKVTSLVKDAIESAAETLGGAERLAAWAKEDPANERAFWASIYPRLLPLQVTGPNGRDLSPTIILTGHPDAPAASKAVARVRDAGD